MIGAGSVAAAEGDVLGPVSGTDHRGMDRLRRQGEADDGQHQQAGEDREGDCEREWRKLGERPGDQCAHPEPPMLAAVETTSNRPGRGGATAERVEIAQVGGRSGGDHPDSYSADEAGHDQARQGGPHQEQQRGGHLDSQGGDQDPATADPVRDMPSQKQAGDHPHRVDGEDHRDHERREAVSLLVEDIQRGGDGRERHGDEKRRRGQPEPAAIPLRG